MEYIYFFETEEPLILKFDLVPLDELLLHEEVIEDHLKKLSCAIKESGVISDPVIIDDYSKVVLDGTHRVCVLKEMHLEFAPVVRVNYAHNAIQLKRWFRILDGSEKDIISVLNNLNYEQVDLPSINSDLLDREIVIAKKNSAFIIEAGKNVFEKYSALREFEKLLRKKCVRIDYVTENEALESLSQGKIIIMTPRIEKQDVINFAKKNLVFRPKSTRHVFKLRPVFLNFPLSLLKELKAAPEARKEVLREFLLERIPLEIEGYLTIDRFYEEDYLLLFV